MLLTGIGMNHIRNGGDLDSEEQLLSDFRADILPPPMFLVKSFANASIMTIHRDAYSVNEDRLAELEKTYWDSERRWAQSALSDNLKAGLATNAQVSGKAFWDEVNKSLKPAARRWDQPAMLASHRRLLELYRLHRAAINKLRPLDIYRRAILSVARLIIAR